jgi:hypothetical protein
VTRRRVALIGAGAAIVALAVAVRQDWRAVVVLAVRIAAPVGLGFAILTPVIVQLVLIRITVGVRATPARVMALIGLVALEVALAVFVAETVLLGQPTVLEAPP